MGFTSGAPGSDCCSQGTSSNRMDRRDLAMFGKPGMKPHGVALEILPWACDDSSTGCDLRFTRRTIRGSQ